MTFQEACIYLGSGNVHPDGGIGNGGWYLAWTPSRDHCATLDGGFDADDLEAIATYMREYHKQEQSKMTSPDQHHHYYDFALTVEQAIALEIIVRSYLDSDEANRESKLYKTISKTHERLNVFLRR